MQGANNFAGPVTGSLGELVAGSLRDPRRRILGELVVLVLELLQLLPASLGARSTAGPLRGQKALIGAFAQAFLVLDLQLPNVSLSRALWPLVDGR